MGAQQEAVASMSNTFGGRKERLCGRIARKDSDNEMVLDSREKRFWRYVEKGDEDDHWMWKGPKQPDGAPYMVNRMMRLSPQYHRWEIEYGGVPAGYVCVPSCGEPYCVNLKHLWLIEKAKAYAATKKKRIARQVKQMLEEV
jgi:hypothetical protein